MPLTPPPDYTKTILSAVVGCTFAVAVWALTRATIPQVGDRDHYLPHGGWYKDGTKAVHYYRPGKLNSVEGHSRGLSFQPWALTILLVAIIIALSYLDRSRCRTCGQVH